jgi:hypothetical protein
MKLINKLKKLIGIDISEYTIHYTNDLTGDQKSQLMNHMINKFVGACRPNRLTVGQKVVVLDFTSPCLNGESLKIISDSTLAPNKADITCIKLNGDVIWSKV